MQLDIIPVGSLQNMKTVLQAAIAERITIEQLYSIVVATAGSRVVRTNQLETVSGDCPSCGVGAMIVGAKIEGLTRYGCPKCRYSEVR